MQGSSLCSIHVSLSTEKTLRLTMHYENFHSPIFRLLFATFSLSYLIYRFFSVSLRLKIISHCLNAKKKETLTSLKQNEVHRYKSDIYVGRCYFFLCILCFFTLVKKTIFFMVDVKNKANRWNWSESGKRKMTNSTSQADMLNEGGSGYVQKPCSLFEFT